MKNETKGHVGRPRVEDKMVPAGFSIPSEMAEKLEKQAAKEGVSKSAVVRDLLKAYLK